MTAGSVVVTSPQDRLQDERCLLLDGALGTELTRRGVSLDSNLWSASGLLSYPQLVREIHADYIQAGAEWITANTFRTHRRNLAKAHLGHQTRELIRLAVELAQQAASGASHRVWVAGSQAPLEDCYRPQDVPNEKTLLREHAEMAANLAAAGVDLILVETQNTIREAVAAARSVWEAGLPCVTSFVCGNDGRLLSGETITEAATAVLPFQPMALMINCLPPSTVPRALAELKSAGAEIPIGVYANTAELDLQGEWVGSPMAQPENYTQAAKHWRELGAKIIGGCCGTTPEHIRQLQDVLWMG